MLRFNELMDLYGGLLTERQHRLARMHYEEDMSFSEIAREEGISRQAAHDAAKHASMALEKFESHLGLLGARAATRNDESGRLADLRRRLDVLRERVRSAGVVYSTDSAA